MIRQLGNCYEIFDLISDGIIIHDAGTGAIVGANRTSCEMFSCDRADFINMDLDDISEAVHPYTGSEAMRWVRKAAAGEPQLVEWHFRRRSGDLFWGEVSLKKARVEGRHRVIALIRDITGRKTAELALRAERERLLTIINGLPAFVCMQDAGHNLRFANKYVCDHFGYPSGRKCHELIAGVRQCCNDCPMNQVFEDRTTRIKDLALDDGRTYQVHSHYVSDLDGAPLLLHIGFDITGRKQMEADLQEAKARAEFYVDLMAHDIGNLNQVAMGFLELGEQALAPEGGDRIYFEKPLEALGKSTKLIDQVRKIQAAAYSRSQVRPIEVNEMLSELAKQYSRLPGRDVSIDYKAGAQCVVEANDLLRDVFSNLVENAIRHSCQTQARIAINSEKADGRCRVAIEDHGPGVPDQIKPDIFSRYYKGRDSGGMGLGLYLVRTLTESFSGTVAVEDRIKGDHTQGSRFIVELPVTS